MSREAFTEQPMDCKDEQVMKHVIKSSVFTDLFGNSKYLIELYRALHPEDTTTMEKDIADVTINNILTDKQYNDLGFRIVNTLLVLVEHQSTWSANIIIRILMYLMQTYNEYFTAHKIDLYSSTKVIVPKPELYVVYTGDRKNRPAYITLKNEFFGGQEVAVDAKVKIIYDGEPGDIINQYVVFTRVCNEQAKLYGRTRKAIAETMRICKDRDVLKEYLESREKEVVDIMVALYDAQEVVERYVSNRIRTEVDAAVNAAVNAAVDAAVSKTESESARRIAENLIALGTLSYEDIANGTGLSLGDIEELASLHKSK